MTHHRTSTDVRDTALVAAVAFGVRLIGVFVSQHYLPVVATDTSSVYLPIARSLAAGSGFQVSGSGVDAARIAPLYPLWLAALVRLSGSPTPVFLIGFMNAVLRAGACVLTFLLCRRYFGRSAAFAATALYVLDPWETFWAGFLLKESLAVPLFLAAVVCLARAFDTRVPKAFVLAGVAIGLATLARFASGALLLAAIPLSLLAARRPNGSSWRTAVVFGACVLAGVTAAVSPWVIRNWRVVGEPVLTTRFVGRKLYTSNAPGVEVVTSGYYSPRMPVAGITQGLSDSSQIYSAESRLTEFTVRYMITHPADVIRRAAAKAANMWRPTFSGASPRNLILLGVPYILIMIAALCGLYIARRRRIAAVPILIPLLVMVGIHLLFRGEIRNRQYLMPLVFAFAGVAADGWISGRRAAHAAHG